MYNALGKDPNYSSDTSVKEDEGSPKVWESDEKNRESVNYLSSHHKENAENPEKNRTRVLKKRSTT